MADAAATYTDHPDFPGPDATLLSWTRNTDKKVWMGQINLTGDYRTGGVALDLTNKGINTVGSLLLLPRSDAAVAGEFDYTNQKIKLRRQGGFTPAGTLSAPAFTGSALGTHQHDAISAGTPAGSVAAPTFTGDAYTPEGSVAAPTFTGDAYTPEGSVAAPTFTPTMKQMVTVRMLTSADASASTQGTAENADEAAAVSAADDSWRAASAVAAGAWSVGALGAHPPQPLACVIQIENPTGGNLNLYEGVMSFLVTGTDPFGSAQTETITFTNTALNKEVAAGKFRWKYGVKPFATITDVTLDNVPANDFTICVGYSSKIFTGAVLPEAQYIQVIEDGSSISITGNIDATYGTFAHGALAASKFVEYTYWKLTGGSGTCSAPAFTGTPKAPTGTNSAPAFTGIPKAPTGTNSAPTFTGSALGTHQHAAISAGTPAGSVAAPTFTGAATTQADLAEVTDSTAINMDFDCIAIEA